MIIKISFHDRDRQKSFFFRFQCWLTNFLVSSRLLSTVVVWDLAKLSNEKVFFRCSCPLSSGFPIRKVCGVLRADCGNFLSPSEPEQEVELNLFFLQILILIKRMINSIKMKLNIRLNSPPSFLLFYFSLIEHWRSSRIMANG